MPQKQALTYSYKPVTRAGAGQGERGKTSAGKSTGGGGGAAAQLSYISGETLRDERTHEFYSNPREDVMEVRINWKSDDSRSNREKLQDMVKEIEQQDGRSNSRQGARSIVSLPVDPRENWYDKEFAKRLGHDVDGIREKMAAARTRICENYDAELRRITRAPSAWAMHASPAKGGREDQIHLHHFTPRRQAELDEKGQVKGLSGRDVTIYNSPGRVKKLNKHMRAFLAREINREFKAIGSVKEFEHRSYEKQMADENAQRAKAGLLPKAPLQPMKHEGPAVTHWRRELKKNSLASVPPKIREVIDANDKIRSQNKEITKANHEFSQRWDSLLRDRYVPIFRHLEAAALMEAERQARGKKDPALYYSPPAERQKYEALIKRADQLTLQAGTNVFALKWEVENLPALVKEHLANTFPLSGAVAVQKAGGVSLDGVEQPELGRRGGWVRFGLSSSDSFENDSQRRAYGRDDG